MQPYGISSDEFADVSSKQAALTLKWYSKISKEKADKLYLGAFLQETGKILISSDVIQEDEGVSFKSEIEMTNNIAQVEKAYVDVSSAEVTAEVFSHWGFDDFFVDMIRYSDAPSTAPDEVKEYSIALHIVKTIAPIYKPFSDRSINLGLKKAKMVGYDVSILEEVVNDMKKVFDENV
jgi:HD-like signal output (HDOD) protein